MLQIILHTPLYVWPLLAYLIWIGWKSTKTHLISWKLLLIMPAIMSVWSACSGISIWKWLICTALGVWLGSLTVRRLNLRFDKERNKIEISGSWAPMVLSLSMFGLKYFLAVISHLYPELKGGSPFFLLDCATSVISGMFTGRVIGYWQRSKIASNSNLSPIEK